MSFKNQKELWQTLLNGKTIFCGTPNESDYREYRYIDDKLMYKTIKEKFIRLLKNGNYFTLTDCSICFTSLYFYSDGINLLYNNSCGCTSLSSDPHRSWDTLDFYLDPSNGTSKRIEEWVNDIWVDNE